MSASWNVSGFGLSEALRIIIPGFFIVNVLGFFIFHDIWVKMDILLLFGTSLLIGFIVHAMALYKLLPGITKIRKKYYALLNNLLHFDHYTSIAIQSSSNDPIVETYARNKFEFGATKLDLCAILILTWIIIMVDVIMLFFDFNEIFYVPWNQIYSIAILILFPYFIYILYDDGKNDIVRAFNLRLIATKKALLNNNDSIHDFIKAGQHIELIKNERAYFHPFGLLRKTKGK